MPEAQQVALAAVTAVGRNEQAGIGRSEHVREAEIEPWPRERERLRQLGCQHRHRAGVTGTRGPDLDSWALHDHMIPGFPRPAYKDPFRVVADSLPAADTLVIRLNKNAEPVPANRE